MHNGVRNDPFASSLPVKFAPVTMKQVKICKNTFNGIGQQH